MKRRDLAKMYCPEKSDVEAVRSLRMWIVHCPDLVAALEEIGQPYKKTKTLTARQVRLIMHYLGDP
ncbi:DUF4248 domain-containing protein [Prevotella sp. P2-180]|uniref:DUF4248 domain-containing protein n=1 Tax=Prevotella sp. P2-180 TaxID=2024224 RepID=UPI0015556E25|nr:DUF4248 domain-containing protein [Prevotella sp. P2-180]